MCQGVPSAPVYKGSRGGGRLALYGAPRRSPPPSRSRTPTRRGKEVGREKERGAPPPSPSPIRTRGRRRVAHLWLPLSLSTKAHMAHYFSRGVPVTSRYSGKMPEPLGTIPMSKCNLPIYESLPLDHSETPRDARNLIQDSEQHSVTNHQISQFYSRVNER